MMKKVSLSVCLLGMCLVMSSWGFLGHKTVQQLAIYELPKSIRPFFYKNKDKLVYEIEISNYTLNSKHTATYLKHPDQAIWKAIRVAAALVPEMLEKEKEVSKSFTEEQKFRTQMRKGKPSKSYTSEFAKAYAVALKSSINDQLIASANLVADFYYTAWVDAGKPDLQNLNQAFSNDDAKSLNEELKLYQKNGLIANDKLISKKANPVKEEF